MSGFAQWSSQDTCNDFIFVDIRKKKATHEDLFKGLKVEKAVIPLPEENQVCPVAVRR